MVPREGGPPRRLLWGAGGCAAARLRWVCYFGQDFPRLDESLRCPPAFRAAGKSWRFPFLALVLGETGAVEALGLRVGNCCKPFAIMLIRYRVNQIAMLAITRLCQPSQAELRQWLADAQKALGAFGLASMGVSPSFLADWRRGRPMRGASCRLVWFAWSVTHCPSNLSNLFTFITWGRFNAKMPQDYRQQAVRLLRRKSGPMVGANGKPTTWGKPWAKALARKRAYLQPGSGVPLLLG